MPGIRGVYIGIDIEVIITLSCVPKIASDLIIECVSLALSLSMYFVASDKFIIIDAVWDGLMERMI